MKLAYCRGCVHQEDTYCHYHGKSCVYVRNCSDLEEEEDDDDECDLYTDSRGFDFCPEDDCDCHCEFDD